ncbi:hypothetical protein BDR06DRAFT_469114 [Suillus hirtellus]|nr:hypothetical protein BDR06DRAFT_469114 [Suillus hirtellus]
MESRNCLFKHIFRCIPCVILCLLICYVDEAPRSATRASCFFPHLMDYFGGGEKVRWRTYLSISYLYVEIDVTKPSTCRCTKNNTNTSSTDISKID